MELVPHRALDVWRKCSETVACLEPVPVAGGGRQLQSRCPRNECSSRSSIDAGRLNWPYIAAAAGRFAISCLNSRATLKRVLLEFEFTSNNCNLLSSSSVSHFANWLKGLRRASKSPSSIHDYPNLSWQRRSLDALRRLAEPPVSVD